MNYLSVCSGIEAATVAWHPLGWQAVAYSEVDAFPSAVLKHHYPDTPNWGDMTKFEEWPDAAIDVFVSGTPCQSFSVAGLRKGLDDPRGNLMLTYGAIAALYRPRWLVWENVPGVLSSNGGRDFGTFLGMLEQLGYGWAYRTLDAQYFGVAQRRRRVFVVGCLGDWRRAAAVLFERASLRGDSAPRREARQGIAGDAVPSIAGCLDTECGGGRLTHQSAVNGHLLGTITARMFGALGARDVKAGALLPVYCDPLNQAASDSTAKTLAARADMDGMGIVAHALRGEGFDASEDGTGRGTPLVPVAFNWQNGGGYGNANEGLGITLDSSGPLQRCNTPAVAFAQNQRDEVRTMTVAGALAAEPGAKQQTYVAALPCRSVA